MTYVRGLTERGIDLDQKKGVFFIKTPPNRAAEAYLDSRYERGEPGFWLMPRPSLVGRGVALAKAATSGRASDEVIERRRLSCFGNGAEVGPCRALEIKPEGAFCTLCKCPQLPWARMDGASWKIARAYLECPLQLPGFSNEVPS